jgi:hypothetical protein
MRFASLALAAFVAATPFAALAQPGPYKVLRTVKVGGDGGFDYIYADAANRKLYTPRSGAGPLGRISIYDLDTLKLAGEIPNVSAHGVVVDAASGHGIASSKPVVLFDAKTFKVIKTIDVQGNPDGIFEDPFNDMVYILSHSAPNATIVDPKDGTIVGTIDLGGAPEQAVSDGKGHLYIDIEDKESIAVVDVKARKVIGSYSLKGKGGTCAGLAIDGANGILFASCRSPQNMVILNAADGKLLTTLPIGMGTDGAVFNPATMEAFSSNGDGTLTVIEESGPTGFAVEQSLTTMPRAKTLTLDASTGHLFLITAEYGAATGPAVGGRPARGPMIPGTFTLLEVGK